MPGELGNEEESAQVGYYERKYTPSGEWTDPGYGTGETFKEHLLPTAMKIVREVQEKQNAKSKCTDKKR